MSSVPTAYTPLETLLLFQALRCEGVKSHSIFNRISDQLKSVRLIRNDPTYDGGRLSPDALQSLYLWLLKEEVKRDLERQSEKESLLQNGDVSPGSRKRKAPSPSLPSVSEASQHTHLIPQLVTRLYARYREQTVREIRENERRYDALKREIEEIEAGKWDERLQRRATQSPRPSSSAHTQPVVDALKTRSRTATPVASQKNVDGNVQAAQKPYTANKIDSLINHGPEAQNGSSSHRRNSSNTTLPPLSEMAPKSPHFGIPPTIPKAVSSQGQAHSPPSTHQSPYASHHGHPVPGSMTSPQVQNSLSRPSSSPRPILPPPPGMKLPPPSPSQQTGSPGLHGPSVPPPQYYSQQPPPHRLSTGPSPTSEHPPRGYPPYQQPIASPGYYQQQPYPDRRTSYPLPQQQYAQSGYQGPPPQYQMQSYPVESHESMNGMPGQHMLQQQQQTPFRQDSQAYAHGPPTYPQQPPNAPSTAPRPAPSARHLVRDIIDALATPPRPQQRPIWKREHRPSPIKTGTPVPQPIPEPLSPVAKRSEPTGRSMRSTRHREGSVAEQSAELELPRTTRGRGRQKRERSPHSVVSSTADESARMTRSQSVSTAAGAVPTSDDRPGSRGNVKVEPSTPAGFVDEIEIAHEVPSGGRITRKRRGTLQTQPPPSKRKRQHSPLGVDEQDFEEFGTPQPRSNMIQANRNFHKTAATIINDINSHKHASYFANAVRDKDAPGYSDIIKHPQNMKAIRAAITAGTKAVNAAASTLDSPSASGVGADGSQTVELERTTDLIPPKAIVNAAQLEKEVMRMLANAVMFNPGEDGMVSDTREMFEDVNNKMMEWRGVEKEGGEGEDVAGAEEEGKGKRRKV